MQSRLFIQTVFYTFAHDQQPLTPKNLDQRPPKIILLYFLNGICIHEFQKWRKIEETSGQKYHIVIFPKILQNFFIDNESKDDVSIRNEINSFGGQSAVTTNASK